jgi:hypothetical protein
MGRGSARPHGAFDRLGEYLRLDSSSLWQDGLVFRLRPRRNNLESPGTGDRHAVAVAVWQSVSLILLVADARRVLACIIAQQTWSDSMSR